MDAASASVPLGDMYCSGALATIGIAVAHLEQTSSVLHPEKAVCVCDTSHLIGMCQMGSDVERTRKRLGV